MILLDRAESMVAVKALSQSIPIRGPGLPVGSRSGSGDTRAGPGILKDAWIRGVIESACPSARRGRQKRPTAARTSVSGESRYEIGRGVKGMAEI
jgi:hypothetical protein